MSNLKSTVPSSPTSSTRLFVPPSAASAILSLAPSPVTLRVPFLTWASYAANAGVVPIPSAETTIATAKAATSPFREIAKLIVLLLECMRGTSHGV